jgi:hypothetical protein
MPFSAQWASKNDVERNLHVAFMSRPRAASAGTNRNFPAKSSNKQLDSKARKKAGFSSLSR